MAQTKALIFNHGFLLLTSNNNNMIPINHQQPSGEWESKDFCSFLIYTYFYIILHWGSGRSILEPLFV